MRSLQEERQLKFQDMIYYWQFVLSNLSVIQKNFLAFQNNNCINCFWDANSLMY